MAARVPERCKGPRARRARRTCEGRWGGFWHYDSRRMKKIRLELGGPRRALHSHGPEQHVCVLIAEAGLARRCRKWLRCDITTKGPLRPVGCCLARLDRTFSALAGVSSHHRYFILRPISPALSALQQTRHICHSLLRCDVGPLCFCCTTHTSPVSAQTGPPPLHTYTPSSPSYKTTSQFCLAPLDCAASISQHEVSPHACRRPRRRLRRLRAHASARRERRRSARRR